MTGDHEDQQGRIARLLELGSEIVGSAGGAAAGLVLGPAGAIAGAAAGPVVTRALTDLANRALSHREQVRVGAAVEIAVQRINERLADGDAVRDDGFFDPRPSGRSDADEVVEGVLLAAQRQFEERKVPLLGRLLANIAFAPIVDAALSYRLISLAERLSYRQLCLLAVVGTNKQHALPDTDVRGEHGLGWGRWAIRRDLDELGFGELEIVTEPGKPRNPDADPMSVDLSLPSRTPGKMVLLGEGRLLFPLMELQRIDQADLAETRRLLWDSYGGEPPMGTAG